MFRNSRLNIRLLLLAALSACLSAWICDAALFFEQVGPAGFIERVMRNDRPPPELRMFDRRSLAEVVRDFRATDVSADPAAPDIASDAESPDLQSLSQRSSVTLVSCPGAPLTRKTDPYGFFNAPGIWRQDADIVLIGGPVLDEACLPAHYGLVALLRSRFLSVVDLGATGYGLLRQLAILQEYGPRTRARLVVWLIAEQDLPRPGAPANSWLAKYLEDANFSQRLADRQTEVDALISAAVDSWLARELAAPSPTLAQAPARGSGRSSIIKDIFRLVHLRAWLSPSASPTPAPVTADQAEVRRILQLGKEATARWGGHLVLAVLPGGDSAFLLNAAKNIGVDGLNLSEMPVTIADVPPIFSPAAQAADKARASILAVALSERLMQAGLIDKYSIRKTSPPVSEVPDPTLQN